MKLYYSPGACSLSPHIVARTAGIPLEMIKTDIRNKTLADGSDYRKINGKGQVPTLELDDGSFLTEGPAIVQYLADQKPESGLAPKNGTIERYRTQEWLNFITSELHKAFSPLFNPALAEDLARQTRERIGQRFDWLVTQLGDKPFLSGETFTVADAYLFTILRWTKNTGIELSRWPTLEGYVARIAARPAVKEALDAEGLRS